jgi:hypothetical protein
MNWAIPAAPAGDTASGSKPDSAINCEARRIAETPDLAAALTMGALKRAGTNEGKPAAPASGVTFEPLPDTDAHGAGPAVKP